MIVDILMWIFIIVAMGVLAIMGIMVEVAFDRMAEKEKTFKQSSARRQKWKDLKAARRKLCH